MKTGDDGGFSKVGLFSNALLLVLKLYFGLVSGSLALLSDAINSFTDVLSSVLMHLAVLEGKKKRDSDNNYGHYAAEPISAFVTSILAILLSFEIFKSSIEGLLHSRHLTIDIYVFGVVLFTIILKSALLVYFKSVEKRNKGQVVKAFILDSRNDIFVSSVVLLGVLGAYIGYPCLDSIVALALSLYIFKSAFNLALENVRFLMGASPGASTINRIRDVAGRIKGVVRVESVRAHYLGDTLHVDVGIIISRRCSIVSAHNIEESVKSAIVRKKDIPHVSYISVHAIPK